MSSVDWLGAELVAVSQSVLVGPIVEPLWAKALIVVGAYAVALTMSGRIISFFVLPRQGMDPPAKDPAGPRFNSSTLIGKCENIITVTFVLLGQETGLALIFAAKGIVRSENIKVNPGYYLGGTLVNLVWGMLVGLVVRLLIAGF